MCLWFYLPTVSPLWHPLIPLCNIPVFLFPMFICLLFQVSPALPNVCHTPVFLLLPLPYFVSVIQFASLPHLLYNIMASHPVHHHPVFSFFPSPIVHLLLFYFPTLPLVFLPPPLYHNPIFFLLSLPYFVSMILFATHHHLYDSLPSTTAPCLWSYPLPQFCVFYYCDWCFCVVVVLRDKVSFMVADHPPYNSSLSQYMHQTPVVSLVPLPSFVSVIPFTNTSTCISPPSKPLLVFSLTPPILCICHSLHQHFHLYLPSICATPCLLSNPSPLLCQLFLSPTLPPVSPLPLCHSLSSL